MSRSNRLRDTAYWADVARNSWLGACSRLSPSVYGRLYRRVRPFTMLSNARLRALHNAVSIVVAADLPGAIVECGAARGGSAAMMGLTLQTAGAKRPLWVFDTFKGLPDPSLNDPDHAIARRYVGQCKGELDEVRDLFDRWNLLEQTHLVQGMFQDTLPSTDTGPIALLHIDGDWYDSVMSCLDHLYDRVVPGGFVQIDDFGYWEGARKAVEDFFAKREITPTLRYIDYAGRQFTKP